MIVVVVIVSVVLLVLVAIAASDQAVARLAEAKASQFLTTPLGGPAAVRVHGEPFLTQALRGRYAEVGVSGAQLRLGELGAVDLDARLRNVYLPLRALVGRRIAEVPCEHITGTLVIGYAELARLSRVPGLTLAHDGRRLLASLVAPIPGIGALGELARVSGEARVSVAEDGAVWLGMGNVAVAGFAVPGIVLNQLLPSLRFPIPLPPLPYGLRITRLDPTAAGLIVHGAADAVVLRRPRPGT